MFRSNIKKRIISSIVLLIVFTLLFISLANIQFPFVKNSFIWDTFIKSFIIFQIFILQVLMLQEFLNIICKINKKRLLFFSSILCMINYLFHLDIIEFRFFDFTTTIFLDSFYLGLFIKSFVILLLIILFSRFSKVFGLNLASIFALFVIIVFLPLSFLVVLNKNFIEFILVILLSICVDTFGFIGGKIYGKRRPFPYLSPKKTIAGYVISISSSISIFIFLYGLIAILSNFSLTKLLKNASSLYPLFALITILSFISISGDLLFSKVKRDYGLLNYSNRIPGHGGILDRLDGISTTLLFFGLLIPLFK